jgi:hypothetical protein
MSSAALSSALLWVENGISLGVMVEMGIHILFNLPLSFGERAHCLSSDGNWQITVSLDIPLFLKIFTLLYSLLK